MCETWRQRFHFIDTWDRLSSMALTGEMCRICHVDGKAGVDLCSPCRCAGSMKFVHEECLSEWIGFQRSALWRTGWKYHVAKCEVCGNFIKLLPNYKSSATLLSVVQHMGLVVGDDMGEFVRSALPFARLEFFVHLVRPLQEIVFVYQVYTWSSSAIWQTVTEFEVKSGMYDGDNYGTYPQFLAFVALSFAGAHIALWAYCGLTSLLREVYRECDRQTQLARCLPPTPPRRAPHSLFGTPTCWGYTAEMWRTIEWLSILLPLIQRGVMVLGRWFLHRLRCQHALRLLFDHLAVELAQYGFCRWVASELLRYDADALEADGVTVESVLSVLVKAAAELALGWTALAVLAFVCFAVHCSSRAGSPVAGPRNSCRDMVKVFARDLLHTTCKVVVQVLVLLVLLPGALACALEYELQPYLPVLLTDSNHTVPRALLFLVLFCLASRLLGFCDALAAETYRTAVADPAFPRLTTAEALVQNARLPWADLLRNCAQILLAALAFCCVVVVLPVRLGMLLLPGPPPVLPVGHSVTVLGAELSLRLVCTSLSVPVLLSAWVVGDEIFRTLPAATAQYLAAQRLQAPTVRPLAPVSLAAMCSWWAQAVAVVVPVLVGLGLLFFALLCAPLLLGRAFFSPLPAPSSEHPLFMFAVGLPLLATLLCCVRAADSEGGSWYQITVKAVIKYDRALLLGTAAVAGPAAVLVWLVRTWYTGAAKNKCQLPVRMVTAYTAGGCALCGAFLLSCRLCAQMPLGPGDVGNAAVEVTRAAHALVGYIPSLAVLLLDLSLPAVFTPVRPFSVSPAYRFVSWIPVYVAVRSGCYLCDVYREARKQKRVVGYKLVDIHGTRTH